MDDQSGVKAEPASDNQDKHSPTRGSSADTERPPSGQHVNPGPMATLLDADSEDEAEDDSDPAAKIAAFDWTSLATRYHDVIRECEQNEMQLMEEWKSLMNFFRVWAESGHSHETDRTYKRLRTRMSHVQNSEEILETKRQHYIRVVEAFESALKLLGA